MSLIINLQTKNPSTLKLFTKQGVNPRIEDIQSLTFTDVLLPDGTQVQNATFQELQNTSWSYQGKNPTALTDVVKP